MSDDSWSAKREGSSVLVELAYPRVEGNANEVRLGLLDVRAADDIRIHYDFERDGWVVQQASTFEWPAGVEQDEGWAEVAFIQAWGREGAQHNGQAQPAAAAGEARTLPCGCPARTFSQRAADTLADEVAVLVKRRVIDARSPAGDALLDYREPPSSPRADRLAEVEQRAVDAELLVAAFAEHFAPGRAGPPGGGAGSRAAPVARALLRDLESARALKAAVKQYVPDWDAGEEPAGVVAHLVERLTELSRELAPLAALRARLKVLENERAPLLRATPALGPSLSGEKNDAGGHE